MKKIAIGLLACWALAAGQAAELHWLTDLPRAQALARAENKMVLLDFTGSDWCGWCKKFDAEVFNTKEFQEYAARNLVLVQLDYPHKKPQSAGLKKANAAWKKQYGIQGYPTLVVLNREGKEIGRQVGYRQGGPKVFIATLEEFKKRG